MSAADFLSGLTELVFLVVFAVVAWQAVRRPRWAHIDIAAFFGVIAFVLLAGDVAELIGQADAPVMQYLAYAGVSALPYILLRLVDDFRRQPTWLMVLSPIALVGMVAASVAVGLPWPAWVQILPVIYFVLLGSYAAAAFSREATRSTSVTQRRMQAVAVGAGLIALVLALVGVGIVLPAVREALSLVTDLLILTAALAFFVGFAPPRLLRRAWQVPALRDLLNRSSDLIREPDTREVVAELSRLAVDATGSHGASIGLWDAEANLLRYPAADGSTYEAGPEEFIAGRAFSAQRPVLAEDAARIDPAHAAEYEASGASAVLAAPITASERRIGVLSVYAERAPIFAYDDLELVRLLAEQSAVVLEGQGLVRDAARVEAREQAARLKDDFLSAVAHDLRTPVTTLLLNAELLDRALGDATEERQARRLESLVREAKRLKSLVHDYLDLTRAEHGGLVARRERRDLVELARQAVEERLVERHTIRLSNEGQVIGAFDALRIRQLVDNLLDNAIKYSPRGGDIEVRVWSDGSLVHLSVRDPGIGIEPPDMPRLFGRFHRGQNVDDRRFQGVGLGLYLCRRIVEEHDGTIAAASEPGQGTTITATFDTTGPMSSNTQPARSSTPTRVADD